MQKFLCFLRVLTSACFLPGLNQNVPSFRKNDSAGEKTGEDSHEYNRRVSHFLLLSFATKVSILICPQGNAPRLECGICAKKKTAVSAAVFFPHIFSFLIEFSTLCKQCKVRVYYQRPCLSFRLRRMVRYSFELCKESCGGG